MARLTLQLFGSTVVRLDEQEVTGFRTNKVQALLVYLAIEPEAHGRERLMELLWPGMPEHSARHNLRQILYHLRNAFPELNAGDQTVDAVLANRQSIQHKNENWWKCYCGMYSYANATCYKNGHPKETHCLSESSKHPLEM